MSFTKFAQEKDAASFREAFLERIQSAVADEIEQQKIAVAQSMFGSEDQLEEEMSDEELDEYLDSLSEEELEALAEEVDQIDEINYNRSSTRFGRLARKIVPGLGRLQAAKRSMSDREMAKDFEGARPGSVDARRANRAADKYKKIATKEEYEQIDEAKKPKFKVGDRVRVNLPGTPAHGHEGKVSDVWKTGQVSVRLGKPGKYVSGKWKFAPKHKGADNFGNSTTVHHSNLEHVD